MPRFKKQTIRLVWAAAGAVAALLILASLFPRLAAGVPTPIDDSVLLALIAAIAPPAALKHLDRRWRMENDRQIPQLLRDLLDAYQSGVSFTKALEAVAEKDYGPLSKTLRRAASRLQFGATYEDVIAAMVAYVDTRMMRLTGSILAEIGRVGGNVTGALALISSHMKEFWEMELERRSEMRSYIFILYIGFFVLLIAIAAIWLQFLKPLLTGGLDIPLAAPFPPDFYLRLLFHMTTIQAFFGGLIAGQMGEGSIGAGLKHSVVMLALTYLAFNYFIT